jgi:hypothetical protein
MKKIDKVLSSQVEMRGIDLRYHAVEMVSSPAFRSLLVVNSRPVRFDFFRNIINETGFCDSVKKFLIKKTTKWLMKNGYLYIANPYGIRKVTLPTKKGKDIGIFFRTYDKKSGEEVKLYCTSTAQQFLFDKVVEIAGG